MLCEICRHVVMGVTSPHECACIWQNEASEQLLGIVTLEDVLEEILQDEILDEGDISEDQESAQRKDRLSRVYADSGRLSLSDICNSEGSADDVSHPFSVWKMCQCHYNGHLTLFTLRSKHSRCIYRRRTRCSERKICEACRSTPRVSRNSSRDVPLWSLAARDSVPTSDVKKTAMEVRAEDWLSQFCARMSSRASASSCCRDDCWWTTRATAAKVHPTPYTGHHRNCDVMLTVLMAHACKYIAHEVGPWSVFAGDSLVVQDGLYAADCNVHTLPSVVARCVRIERSEFQQSLLHPLPRRDSASSPRDEKTSPTRHQSPIPFSTHTEVPRICGRCPKCDCKSDALRNASANAEMR